MESAGMRTGNLTGKIEELLHSAADGWLVGSPLSGSKRAAVVDQLVEWLVASMLLLVIVAPTMALTMPLPLAIAAGLFSASIILAATACLAATGRLAHSRILALVAFSVSLAWLCLAQGGMASPFVLLAGIVPLEAGILSRSRNAVLAGSATALGIVGAVGLASWAGYAAPASGSAMISSAMLLFFYGAARGFDLARHGRTASRQTGHATARFVAKPLGETGPMAKSSDHFEILNRLPGLVTLHDRTGNVARSGGADKSAFDAWMQSADGGGYLARIHVADRITFLNAFDSLRRGELRCRIELRMDRQQGETQFAHLTVDLMAEQDENGEFCGAIVQSRDISELVEHRVSMASAAREAEDSNEAKSRFLAAVSHELRTPLNAIIGFSDILAREFFGKFSDERQSEYVGLIHQSGHHLLSLVNTMLDMSKIEAGRYELFAERFPIGDVVKSSEAMLGLQAEEKGVTLTNRIARDIDELNADRRAIQQILINLVGNSIKFTEPGGVVTTDVEIHDESVRLSVSDTGIGMPESQLARIGEPFLQGQNSLSRNYEGTGLGLSLVKGLVALHGGELSVESRLGEGTRVMIDLPQDGSGIDRAKEAAGSTTGPVAFPPRLENKQIEDNTKLEMSNDATTRIA